jgi:hypothetical protein
MDEVDGRPGAVALQSGHLDAPRGVPMVSLSLLDIWVPQIPLPGAGSPQFFLTKPLNLTGEHP